MPEGDIVKLNVSGVTEGFEVSKKVLCSIPESSLSNMFSGKYPLKVIDERVFLDRDSKIFRLVLSYLRNNRAPLNIDDNLTANLFELELKHWRLLQPKENDTIR